MYVLLNAIIIECKKQDPSPIVLYELKEKGSLHILSEIDFKYVNIY